MTDIGVDEFLDHYFLEHFGVKGMKWGVRNNRSMNKASRAKDREDREKKIDKARDRFSSGRAKKDLKKAKAQYKVDKHEMGTREAKKILNKARNKNLRDYQTASQIRDGKEAATNVLLVAGAIGISALISSRR